MDVDESFAEHVSVRWSTLYRLAVLLAGTERADDLIQAALARAFASWRTVREAASPDAALRKILVDTSVDSTDSAAGDATRSGVARDDEELWSRISTLPPRERAVVVLLYYEDLSESQVAHTLGCSKGTVKALALAALTTNIDLAEFTTREVRDELARRADAAVIPPPPIDSLMARGHEHRRRRV